ncbi:MAG: mechanosensitive ion channel protein MscS [Gemmatales bacterium]|nr:MAG: mechanosensitive ion channel protein MscS [Gemmatales bacterium]
MFCPPRIVVPFAQMHLLESKLPGWMSAEIIGMSVVQWVALIALGVISYVLGAVLQSIVLQVTGAVARRTQTEWDEKFLELLPGPTRYFLSLIVFRIGLPLLELSDEAADSVSLIISSLLIIILTWFASRFLTLASQFIEDYLTRQTDDPNRIRSIKTQISIPRGILRFLVILLGISLVFMQFEVVRDIGVSLIASAGLAGLIVGLAAQKTIANILAGIQLAIFQPVKIGDVVIIENEWGWIEEITLTYIVVKVWDLRRLVLPVSYVLDRPFQNWTIHSTELLGTVFLYTDYTVSVDEIRAELKRVLEETDLWDGKAQGVIVNNLTERTVEIRALVSAADSGKLWDLRCLVREKLLAWLQAKGKDHYPLHRVEMHPLPQV